MIIVNLPVGDAGFIDLSYGHHNQVISKKFKNTFFNDLLYVIVIVGNNTVCLVLFL